MPTYEYRCTACGETFERLHSIKDEPLTVCPQCSGLLERLLGTGAGIIFKGSGFYATEHRSKEYKDKARSESDSATVKSATDPTTKTGGTP